MPLGLYPYTASGNPEWDKLLRHREEGLNRMLRQLAMSTVVHSQVPQMDQYTAFAAAGPLLGADPGEQQRRAMLAEQQRPRDWNELLGAADFYGIRNAESMNPEELREQIGGRREYMQDTWTGQQHSFFDKLYDTVATTIGVTGIGATDAVLEVAQKIPFLGDAIARTKTIQDADRWLAMLEEGFTADLPETSRAISTGLANMLGYAFPAALSWRMAGAVGALPRVAQVGARVSPVGRAMMRGAAAEWAIEGGGDAPISERALNIAFGSVFGAGESIGGVVGRTAMGGGLGALAGSLAEDGDPRAMLIGAAAGAAGANVLPMLFRRIQQSFPSRSYGGGVEIDPATGMIRHPGLDTGYIPNDMQHPVYDADVVGEQLMGGPGAGGGGGAGAGGGPRLLPPGSPLEGTVEDPFRPRVGRGQPWLTEESSFLGDADYEIIESLAGARSLYGQEVQPALPGQPRLGPGAYEMGPNGLPQLPPGSAPTPEGPSVWMQTPPEVRGFIRRVVGERRAARRAAETDPMTGAGNRLAWERARITAEADPTQAIVVFDVNNLKAANDLVGHSFGDSMIQGAVQAAGKVSTELNVPNRIFRLGGDEFAAIVPVEQAELFRVGVEEAYGVHPAGQFKVSITGSAGETFEAADALLNTLKLGRKGASASYRPMEAGEAVNEAAALSKTATIVESPALAPLAKQATFDDADVVRAVVDSYPGQVGVVRNVGDMGKTIRRVLAEQMPNGVGPQDFRVVGSDILVSAGRPITNKMVKEYERFRMFSGQRAVTAQGNEVTIIGLGDEASTVIPLHGGDEFVVPTRDLLPTKSSGMSDASAPELYQDFETFAQVRLDQQAMESGIPRLDLYGDEAATQLPLLMDEYIQAYGIPDGYHGSALKQVIEQEHLNRLRQMIPPEDAALLADARASLRAVQLSNGLQPAGLDELAEARGMRWIPGNGDGGALRDELSDLEVPVNSEEAAQEFLRNFDREVPDVTPATLIPMEVAGSAVGFNPASALPNRYVDVGDYTRSVEADLQLTPVIEEIIDAEYEILREAGGAGGGGRPPNEPPRMGRGFGSEGPFLPSNDPQAIYQRHSEEWYRVRRDDPTAYFAFEKAMDGLITNYMASYRHAAMRLESLMNRMGVSHGRIWESYDAVTTAHDRAVTMAIPWQQRLSVIAENVRSKYARDGTFRKVYTAPTVNDRERLMAKYGFTPAERQAMDDLQALTDEFLFTEGRRAFPGIGRLERYWPTRVIREDIPESYSSLPDELTWQRQLHRTEGGEVDPSLVSAFSGYFRSFYKYTEMKPHYEHMKRLFNQPNVPASLKNFANTWLEARFWGIDPSQDKAIRALRTTFEKVGIPMTHRDVAGLMGAGFTAQYRGMLGGRIDPVVRDLLQMLVPAARVGDFKLLGEVLKDFGTNSELRREMIQSAYDGGWLQRNYVKVADADLFSNTAWEQPGIGDVRFTPAQEARRESFARVGDFWKDQIMQPLGLKSGIQGRWADMLYWYQKQGDMARVVSGEMGKRKAARALADYVQLKEGVVDEAATRLLRDKLLSDSGVLMFQAPIKRKFMELVDSGDYDGAMKMFANQMANLQNRYGAVESAPGVRKAGLIGRMYMQLGTHAQQQINEYAQVFNDTSIPRMARLGFAARVATIDTALAVGKAATGWNLRKLMITGGLLSPIAAPTMWALVNDAQRALASLREATGEPLGPDQQALLGSGSAPGTGILPSLNPFGGLGRSIEGFGQAIGNENWLESTLRFGVTGQRSDPVYDRMLQGPWPTNQPPLSPAELNSPFIPTSPRQPGFGTQNVDSILMQYPSQPGGGAM